MDQSRTPLFSALQHFRLGQPLSLHVPGHKNGKVFPDRGLSAFQSILSFDMTELDGLDDLHHPEGAIAEAMDLLSNYYQTKKSYFLINGSTVGNLAMILGSVNRGEQILVQRNAHKSVFHALEMGGLKPVFIHPKVDEGTGIPLGLALRDVTDALHQFPDAKALVLTYPNYYGMASEVREIIGKAHEHGIPVLVDEAHGPHFFKKTGVPVSTLELGADAVVHSAHKTLPAMTMGSFFHINKTERLSVLRIEKWLNRLQSSSPSYPIMASLDLARYFLATLSNKDWDESLRRIKEFRQSINENTPFYVAEPGPNSCQDPFKIILNCDVALSGYDVQEQLSHQGIYAEMADPKHVLFVLGIDPHFDGALILQALNKIKLPEQRPENSERLDLSIEKNVSSPDLTYDEMERLPIIEMPLIDAEARYSAENLIPYPPGIPLVMQGEKLTRQSIDTIGFLLKNGARFQGNNSLMNGIINIYVTGIEKEKIE